NLLAAPTSGLESTPVIVDLSDGDQLVAHDTVPAGWQPGDPIALLVHGLGGCSESGYMRRIALRFIQKRVRACRLDLRGSGAGMGLARRLYNATCSGDVRAALEQLHARYPGSPLLLAGFSLGGGIVLTLAGH